MDHSSCIDRGGCARSDIARHCEIEPSKNQIICGKIQQKWNASISLRYCVYLNEMGYSALHRCFTQRRLTSHVHKYAYFTLAYKLVSSIAHLCERLSAYALPHQPNRQSQRKSLKHIKPTIHCQEKYH